MRLLTADAVARVTQLREHLSEGEMTMPTSTPDIVLVRMPDGGVAADGVEAVRTDLPGLDHDAQRVVTSAHQWFEGAIEPNRLMAGVAIKKSLRSDRLYQQLYEAIGRETGEL